MVYIFLGIILFVLIVWSIKKSGKDESVDNPYTPYDDIVSGKVNSNHSNQKIESVSSEYHTEYEERLVSKGNDEKEKVGK